MEKWARKRKDKKLCEKNVIKNSEKLTEKLNANAMIEQNRKRIKKENRKITKGKLMVRKWKLIEH